MAEQRDNFDGVKPGKVYLVGAGPGDPGLITVRGLELLRRAEVVVYDALANPVLLTEVSSGAELIDAGKRAKKHKLTQDETNALLYEKAAAGREVVRLKGGDPYVFARGGEEAMYLHERGIEVEIVPGITSGIAGPAYAGIPITHRNVAVTATFITAHEDPTKAGSQLDYGPLAELVKKGGTLCFYMGVGRLPLIVDELTKRGVEESMPAAIVQWGTMSKQRSLRSTLGEIVEDVKAAGIRPPSMIVVGPVVAVDDAAMGWFERKPLLGQTVVITRTRQQSSTLRAALQEAGAKVLEAPSIVIEPAGVKDLAKVRAALANVADYAWLVLTSSNGLRALAELLDEMGLDSRALAGVKLAVVGPATAAAARELLGVRADFVSESSVGEVLAEGLIATGEVDGQRILLLRGDQARAVLREKLVVAGGDVDDLVIYQTKVAAALPDVVMEALAAGEVDWLTFTSSSTARNLAVMLGDQVDLIQDVRTASIGPITSQTMQELGWLVNVEASEYDVDGLVAALLDSVAGDTKGD